MLDTWLATKDDGRKVAVVAVTDQAGHPVPAVELDPAEAESWHRRALLGSTGFGESDTTEGTGSDCLGRES
jgi:hypothetical protein